MYGEVELKRHGEGIVKPYARSLRVIRDAAGEPWLCDKSVDPNGDLAAQGCWRCRDLAFTASD